MLRRKFGRICIAVACFAVSLFASTTASWCAETPVHVWSHPGGKPRAMLLAIHGLAMHGTVYDTMGRHLTKQNVLVAAPDLRGFGHWRKSDPRAKANYAAAEEDLVEVAETLRNLHPGVPLFVLGESLGGTAAIRLAAKHPDLIDGLILSAPALRYRCHVTEARSLVQIALLATNPTRGINVANYINYFSNDDRIRQEELSDPLLRRRMGLGELLSSCFFMSNSSDVISAIPADMPVLIMQGRQDQMVKQSAIELLEDNLRSQNRRTCYFPQSGHIMLETNHARPEALNTVSTWISSNAPTPRTAHMSALASP